MAFLSVYTASAVVAVGSIWFVVFQLGWAALALVLSLLIGVGVLQTANVQAAASGDQLHHSRPPMCRRRLEVVGRRAVIRRGAAVQGRGA